MRHSEYWLAGIGLVLVAVLAFRVLPREQPAPVPEAPPPAERTFKLGEGLELTLKFPASEIVAGQLRAPRISGQVVAEDGSPVAGANIRGYLRNGRPARGLSDETGAFSMRELRNAARLYFRVDAPGFAVVPAEPVNGALDIDENNREGIQLVLEPESTASGVVVDSTGAPVPGVRVGIEPVDDQYFDEWQTGVSGDNGAFTMRQIAAGEYSLFLPYVLHQGDTGAQRFDIGRAEHVAGLRIVIPAETEDGIFLSGLVTDRTGNPVAGVRLNEPNLRWVGITERDGRFQARVFSVPITLTARHSDYSFATVTVDNQTRDLRIVLDPPATVSGRVVYAKTGKPVTRFRIRSRLSWFDHYQNPEGRFDNVRLDSGTGELTVWAHGHPPAVVEFAPLATGEVRTGIEVRVAPPSPEGTRAYIEGRVVDGNGWPVPRAQVSVGESRDLGISDVTNNDGRFLLVGSLPQDSVEILVTTPERGKQRFSVRFASYMPETELLQLDLDSPDAVAVPD